LSHMRRGEPSVRKIGIVADGYLNLHQIITCHAFRLTDCVFLVSVRADMCLGSLIRTMDQTMKHSSARSCKGALV
jgi:hypothetical protein